MYRFFKRAFCIFASLVGITITLPIWIIAIIGIEISDPGPIFYTARRIGKDGKEFKMFKFRSMTIAKNANENSFKADASRIFPWGNIMRNLKIDELPQLINCLSGNMAIIGPRPASVDQVHIVRAGEFIEVNNVTPGLSGPAALYDYLYGDTISDETDYERLVLPTRLALELYYVRHGLNLKNDILMIWWTVRCIFNSIFGLSSEKILGKLKQYVVIPETVTQEEKQFERQ